MNNELYWLWMSNIKGIGQKKRSVILKCFETPEKAFLATECEIKELYNNYPCFKKDKPDVFLKSRNIEKIEAYAKKLKKTGIHYISIENKKYPKHLKHIYDPPSIFYYRGQLPEDKKIKIAIVGARKCTPYGKKAAEYFAQGLVQNNIVIISGMARGIDTAAHIGALRGNGDTVAVLGCGVNVCYPKENLYLMEDIIERGCIISESPVNSAPIAANFPLRNRIISGMCDGVLIIEAAKKSGSLITADIALEQSKDVFSVPGRIFDIISEGTNNLIKMGAKPVTKVEDILEEYMDVPVKTETTESNFKLALEKDEQIVYSCISLDPIYIDALYNKTKLNMDVLQFVLMKLELKGIIEQLPNKYFIKRG